MAVASGGRGTSRASRRAIISRHRSSDGKAIRLDLYNERADAFKAVGFDE